MYVIHAELIFVQWERAKCLSSVWFFSPQLRNSLFQTLLISGLGQSIFPTWQDALNPTWEVPNIYVTREGPLRNILKDAVPSEICEKVPVGFTHGITYMKHLLCKAHSRALNIYFRERHKLSSLSHIPFHPVVSQPPRLSDRWTVIGH
jgi:hypothetical protein